MFRLLIGKARRMRMKVHKPFGKGIAPGLLRISLCNRSADVARPFADLFREADGVEVVEGDLLDLDCDALVGPANSFGFMGGGVDRAIDRFYDGAAQKAALDRISEKFYGELPVGTATVIGMSARRFPFLVVAPTMRVPGNVRGTINAHLAMRADLAAALDHGGGGQERISSLAIRGLCTGSAGCRQRNRRCRCGRPMT